MRRLTDTNFVAHTTQDEPIRYQSVHDHLVEVRDLCATFGADLGIGHVAGLAGWLHDAGKYSQRFQRYILNNEGKRGSVNHAFAGAWVLEDISQDSSEEMVMVNLVSNAILAHHNPRGPYDFVDPGLKQFPYVEKMTQEISDWSVDEIESAFFTDFSREQFDDYYEAAVKECEQIGFDKLAVNQSLFQRFIASCLVDADHIKTADFMSDKVDHHEAAVLPIEELDRRNGRRVIERRNRNNLQGQSSTSNINHLRDQMSDECAAAAGWPDELMSLSVPTGGGKTLASLRFGLRRCVQKKQSKIIYVVPFTTVIEQNAAALRSNLGLSANDYANVLEYHSTVSDDDQVPKDERYYYAKDTWDAPIIMTSQVAYLNALYGSGSKNLRHMHRLVNSTVIFDEIQSMPLRCVEMDNAAINWLTHFGKSTCLLCTATQPALSKDILTIGIEHPREIVHDLSEVKQSFKRVEVVNSLDEIWDIPRLTGECESELEKVNSLLVVLNTKRAVKLAYQSFDAEGVRKFHLSTSMCVAHRKRVFAEINNALALAKEGKGKVVVFSTKLIEAGVDVSFASVFRSCAGLDSIVQSAGRCNRNHEMAIGQVRVFLMDAEVERLSHGLKDIARGIADTRDLFHDDKNGDPLSDDWILKYFKNFFGSDEKALKYESIVSGNSVFLTDLLFVKDHKRVPNGRDLRKYLDSGSRQIMLLSASPHTVAEKFKPIDSKTVPVLVQWPECPESGQLVAEVEARKDDFNQISALMKKAQQFVVQVYMDGSQKTLAMGNVVVDYIPEFGLWIAREGSYNDEFGLDPDGGSKLGFDML